MINYDFPFSPQIYTHRTGRTGRMGREGVAMTFVSDRDLGNLKILLQANRIEPVWRGNEPDLERPSSGGRRRGRGKRPPRKRGPRRRSDNKPVSSG